MKVCLNCQYESENENYKKFSSVSKLRSRDIFIWILTLVSCLHKISEHGSNKRNINFAVLPLYFCQNMTNMNIVGPGFEGDTNLNCPSPPSPELLQHQILYNRIPESRQLETHNHFDSSQGQASQEINPGTENEQMPQPQITELTNVPPSNFSQVKQV